MGEVHPTRAEAVRLSHSAPAPHAIGITVISVHRQDMTLLPIHQTNGALGEEALVLGRWLITDLSIEGAS